MLDLKGTMPTHWLLSFQKKKIWCGLISLGGLLLPSIAFANYAPKIVDPSAGYKVNLNNNTSISTSPYIGSDGLNYYQIGQTIKLQEMMVSGNVLCVGTTWGDVSSHQLGQTAYHKMFIYPSPANITINNSDAYIINNNVLMTVYNDMSEWTLLDESIGCSNPRSDTYSVPVSGFVTPRRLTLTFYIRDNIIDGKIIIPAMDLAGYVRAFVKPLKTPDFTSWPIGTSSAPVRILPSSINLNASCSTMSSTGQAETINLRHGNLNTLNYDSVVTENVTYSCKFSIPTKVRLHLDYATDSDPQKRLPMTNSQNSNYKIYSELTMTDEITGQTGKDFKIDIKDLRTIKITSHIQGSNAVAGDYKGSAWLIATFD
ncbi:adhesin [Proteus mirabilis]|uniref:adhesin n=1 Tax=Proteus mirabilis TaxID=584 RepID=UPI003D2C6C24